MEVGSLPFVTASEKQWSPIISVSTGRLKEMLRPIQGNSPDNAEGPYICFLFVGNIYKFSRFHSENYLKEAWLFDQISPKIVKDISENRCLLVLDLSNEGSFFDKKVFDDILFWVESKNIDPKNVMLVCQNRSIGSVLEKMYPGRSLIETSDFDYFVKLMANAFSLNEDVFNSKYSFKMQDAISGIEGEKAFHFLCMNSTIRPNRIAFASMLKNKGVLCDTLFSWHGNDFSGKTETRSFDQVESFLNDVGALDDLKDDATYFFNADPVLIDSVQRGGNDLWQNIIPDLFYRSVSSLVTETEFSNGSMKRITEKSIKAYCMGHPTIIFGNPGSLNIIRSFGFQTFAPIIDETYDSIESTRDRFSELINSILSFHQKIKDNNKSVPQEIREVCKYNINWAFHGFQKEFDRSMSDPFAEKLLTRLKNLEQ